MVSELIPSFSDTIPSWQSCQQAARKRDLSLSNAIGDDDRLLCDTDNFFAISGLGAFVLGYILVIPKDTKYLSFASLPEPYHSELRWLLNNLSNIVYNTYNKIINKHYQTNNIIYIQTVIFEHGAIAEKSGCACSKQAHLHLMILPYFQQNRKAIAWNQSISSQAYHTKFNVINIAQSEALTKVVNRRIREYLSILSTTDNINLSIQDLQEYQKELGLEVSLKTYPKCAYYFWRQEQPYIFWGTPDNSLNVICPANLIQLHQPQKLSQYLDKLGLGQMQEIPLGSQLGREVIAELWGISEPFWNWRDSEYPDNILKTMLDIAPDLLSLQNQPRAKFFNYRSSLNTAIYVTK
jgi:hypothetical protein